MTHDAVPSPLPTPIITQYVSAKEVAAQLHIGVRKARKVLRHDRGPGVRFGDRTERWPAAAVQALIEREFAGQEDATPILSIESSSDKSVFARIFHDFLLHHMAVRGEEP